MAVATKHEVSKNLDVHFVHVKKTNRKGASQLIGGTLCDHEGHISGDFHTVLRTTVNAKPRTINVEAGDIVFYTTSGKRKAVRWQVLSKADFKKRFPSFKV